METPVLVLRGGGRDIVQQRAAQGKPQDEGVHGLFQTYREEFESAWTDSRPVS
jgi:hypothetical protein